MLFGLFGKKKKKINEMIFNELIKRGYSKEGQTRIWDISDSKLWYLTPEQAQAFLDLEKKDPKQKMFVQKEVDLIKNNFKEIMQEIREAGNEKLNIIDLGCGSGDKALVFVGQFKDQTKIRYCPIDISNFMVEKALKTLSRVKNLGVVKFKYNLLDFLDLGTVSSTLRNKDYRTNLLLLLGGSLENSDIHELLHDIKSAMKDQDYLLIGNKLTHPNPAKMVHYYNESKHIDNMLFKTIVQLGFDRSEVQYNVRFRGERVEMFYIVKADKTVVFGDKKIEFKKGDKVIVAISYKYTQDKLLEALNLYFDEVELFTNKEKDYALALCKK